jgi:hypothetical protein
MGKSKREPCAFCPATADITDEHLWDSWAGRMFGPREYVYTRKDSEGHAKTWEHDKLSPKAHVVCGRCNNEWMSEVSTKAKTFIGGAICNRSAVALSDDGIAAVAAWGFLKAVVADHMYELTDPFYTFSDRQLFRETLAIPNGVQMWLGGTLRHRGVFKGYTIDTPLSTPQRFELNCFTYGLGHFVIQVVGSKWKKKSLRRHANPPAVRQSFAWSSTSVPFWPSVPPPVAWPPAMFLGERAMEQFIFRWNKLTR